MKKYKEVVGDGGSNIIAQVTEKLSALSARMKNVKYKIAVMSGKGGVGKSTVTVSLAANMAKNGFKVGILDADLNGPSIPKMMGIETAKLATEGDGVRPPTGAYGIKIMSTELFMSAHGQPINWDGPSSTYSWISVMEATALRELVADTAWGELDFLFIDLPPVLARFRDLTQLLGKLDGTIVVTIPTGISNRIVVKSINAVREMGSPIIGVIENMKGFACVKCGAENNPYEGGDEMAESFDWIGAPYLGRVPFDKKLLALSNEGLTEPGANAGGALDAFDGINKKILAFVGETRS
ncbi:MAG: P-loop NTPase [Nitrospinae bacterium]|nr:P-loop NTPase [Nitrospinota bacterium]